MSLHPILVAAADGALPDWSVATAARREHMQRVAELMRGWSAGLELAEDDRVRWVAAGLLHDTLRDEDHDALRPRVSPELRSLPGPVLHGPAAAERLRVEGVLDGELLQAVAYHTAGSGALGALGRALYCADFLEPGRSFLPDWRADLRARMPGELDRVTKEIVGARLKHLVDRGMPFLQQTVDFWASLGGVA